MPEYVIQKEEVTSKDINQVVKIHRKEINQGFLSSLGDIALGLLFSLAANSKFGILLIAKDINEDKICGFLLGTTDTGKFYKDFLLKKSLKAMVFLLPKLFSIDRIRKIFETLLYPSKEEIQNFPKAELLDIAISLEYQGTGLAQQLFREFSKRMLKLGIKNFKITTGESLTKAQRFYESLGAEKVGEVQVHQGSKTVIYVYNTEHEKQE